MRRGVTRAAWAGLALAIACGGGGGSGDDGGLDSGDAQLADAGPEAAWRRRTASAATGVHGARDAARAHADLLRRLRRGQRHGRRQVAGRPRSSTRPATRTRPARLQRPCSPPGDVVLLKGGVEYDGTIAITASGTAAAPIVLEGGAQQGWGSRQRRSSTARHTRSLGISVSDASYVIVEGFELRNFDKTTSSTGHQRRRRRQRHGRRQPAARHLLRDRPDARRHRLGAAARHRHLGQQLARDRRLRELRARRAATRASRSPPTAPTSAAASPRATRSRT